MRHPRDVARSVGDNRTQATGRDRRSDQHPVEHALGEIVSRITRRTGHLRGTVLARQRRPEERAHGRTPAAVSSARRAAPRAIASLYALPATGLASASAASIAVVTPGVVGREARDPALRFGQRLERFGDDKMAASALVPGGFVLASAGPRVSSSIRLRL